MRITVNLSIFFHDHRSLAKIFISKNMKCIKDVENHITGIFKIHDFYLKCDNQYLPPTEDVQILNYDDIIWAVPRKNNTINLTDNDFQLNNETELEHAPVIEKKKKKKKQLKLDNDEMITHEKKTKKKNVNHIPEIIVNYKDVEEQECNDLMEVDNSPAKPKKQKKRKQTYTKDETSKNSECESSTCDSGAKKQKLKISSSDCVQEQVDTPKDSGRDSFEVDKSVTVTPENTNINVKSLVHSFESGKTNFAKCFRQAINDSSERRVNIVKTIIVSKPSSTTESTSNSPNVEDSSSCKKQKENPDAPSDAKNENDNNTPQGEDCSKLETSDGILNDTFNVPDANVNKRKRRRTHRKKRDSSCREFSAPVEQPVYNFIHKPLIVQAPTHIRFSEEHSPKDREVAVLAQSTPNREVAAMVQSTPNHNEVAAMVQSTPEHREVAAIVQSTPSHNEVAAMVQSTPEHNEVAKHLQSSIKFNGVPKSNGLEVDNDQRSSLTTEVIVISESPSCRSESPRPEESIKETVANAKSTYTDEEIEECILKQPITAKAEPRIGDVIAFRILRISDKYTPEVSSTVVGKVVNYTPEDKEITFNIVYGREQCLMPQGKFSLEQDECLAEDQSQFQCCWSSLLEPRLLFP